MAVYALEWSASCDEKGCLWWEHASSQDKAEQRLAAHMAFAHPPRCTWSYDYDDGNSGVARCARAEGHEGDCDPRLHGFGRFNRTDRMAFQPPSAGRSADDG